MFHPSPAFDTRNSARVGAAPVILDRAQVRAYAERVNDAVTSLASAIRSRQLEKGISGDSEHNIPYDPSDQKLPWAWWVSWFHFKDEWEAFYESIQGFDLFGPTVWSVWASIEDFETRYMSFKVDFVTKYSGITTAPDLTTQKQIDEAHPSNVSSWGVGGSWATALPWAMLLGIGGALYLMRGGGSQPVVIRETAPKKARSYAR